MTNIDRLNLMKQIKARNEQRRKEFAAKEAAKKEYNERLFDLYAEARITEEEFYARLKK